MKRKNQRNSYCRRISGAQERRAYYASPELVRAKRKPTNLQELWDNHMADWQVKSWKYDRKTQYRENRGQRHEIEIFNHERISTWDFKDYFRRNGIPYQITQIYSPYDPNNTYKWGRLIKEVVVWWSDKNIGIEYLLRKFSY